MIYTITFNPSIDYIVRVKNFKAGEVNRVEMDQKYPGGKGINVSRVLNGFNIKNKALGFTGGFTGEYVKRFLENEGIETDFINVTEDTRINVKLKSNEETEINGAGPNIEKTHLEELIKKVQNAKAGDFIVLAGNAQSSLPRNVYTEIQKGCTDKEVKFIVDTTGEALVSTLEYKPFLVKPNIKELAEIFDAHIITREEALQYGQELIQMGAQNVVISMAGEGALLVCSEGYYHASAPKGIVKNSVGAGDSMIGGFLADYSKNFNVVEAFKWAAASGSATAFSMDLCTKKDVENLINEVKITKIKL
ncbi:tagatose-6-phosphate kinase [Clostridium homopropionicum DSM 5847]|uniref:Tagatose-6-phosphate kinase n=1 Tax=Clostridium homopropionicum DSM 5847 TaxID=1121318 RepID=A0A0L6Z5J2_9CLOT|nr:1-phosphofructokinase [Clostridium homopropionicum]KOA18103.1 tagatose-6-phosphate kinase [Clostridium homopropionicum DSM 5847]SFG71991.1 fructose-1-phosphate kinase [Clostridium homopropionicum]